MLNNMRTSIVYFYILFVSLCVSIDPLDTKYESQDTRARTFMNEIAVNIKGGLHIANRIAEKHGFVNKGQIGDLDDYYLFVHHAIKKRSTRPSYEHHEKLSEERDVHWFQQQTVKRRVKRDCHMSSYNPQFIDPLYPTQWYLQQGGYLGLDLNVRSAWQNGYTGKQVIVTILDDGIERDHPDLVGNYDPLASYDINDDDGDPMPRYDPTNENRHGTRCAGEVSASANNSICGVGIAYDSKIGGVRMLDGDVNDAVEAQAISLRPQHIDIYSASWGPDDNGQVVDGPDILAQRAFLNGIFRGRNGKGSIFVWASGNGGSSSDSCNCDGYTNSIYTLSISSTTSQGRKPWYLEECASTIATTYSSGSYGEPQIATTDLHYLCTQSHTGTSASAPLAAGIVALTLEANPNLTWRDVQHITIRASCTDGFQDGEFMTNGVGRRVSLRYGFGLMNAGAMTELARVWQTVPDKRKCEIPGQTGPVQLSGSGFVGQLSADSCIGQNRDIRFLEHVQLKLTLTYTRRGAIALFLTSPSGTRSNILQQRPRDLQPGRFSQWPFLSVQFWGENPAGTWTFEIQENFNGYNQGMLIDWSLILHGTQENPERLTNTTSGSGQGRLPTSHIMKQSSAFPDSFDDRSGDRNKVNMLEKISNSSCTSGECNITCDVECLLTCSGPEPEECHSCRHYRIGKLGACVQLCPDGFYVGGDNICHECDKSCKTCLGEKSSNCKSCPGDKYFIVNVGTCVDRCPVGYYTDTTKATCMACSSVCKSCSDKPDKCTSCQSEMVLKGGLCRHTSGCKLKRYQDPRGNCHDCHVLCETCRGKHPDQCILCPRGYLLLNSTCILKCPKQHYTDLTSSIHECRRCHASCLLCDGPSASDCKSCLGTRMVVKKQCVDIPQFGCKPAEYEGVNGECDKCHESCTSCNGPSKSDCLRCANAKYLQIGQCVDNCMAGFYVHQTLSRGGLVSFECRLCQESCQTCSGAEANSCISCPPGVDLQDGRCERYHGCPDGLYFHSKSRKCRLCDHSCLTCKGPNLVDCLACRSGLHLSPQSLKCVPVCSINLMTDCCVWNEDTEKCASTLNITDFAIHAYNSIGDAKTSQSTSKPSSISIEETNDIMLGNKTPSSKASVLIVMVFVCLIIGILVLAMIVLRHAKSEHKFCWAYKYQKLDHSSNDLVQLTKNSHFLTKQDYVDEDELNTM